jgi:hypothetical protein
MKTFSYWALWIAKPRTSLPSPPISSPRPAAVASISIVGWAGRVRVACT